MFTMSSCAADDPVLLALIDEMTTERAPVAAHTLRATS